MTLIIGWLDNNQCMITADNMETSSGSHPFGGGTTVTGQSKSIRSSDTAFKIMKIGGNCVVGIAGSADFGYECIIQMKSSGTIATIDQLKSVLGKLPEQKGQDGAALMLGFYDSSLDKSFLLTFHTNSRKITEGDFFTIGTRATEVAEYIKPRFVDFYGSKGEGSGHPFEKISLLSYLGNMYLFGRAGKISSREGIGGIFFGVTVSKAGVVWQKKTYCIDVDYSVAKDLAQITPLIAFMINGVFFVVSCFAESNRMMLRSENLDEASDVELYARRSYDELFKKYLRLADREMIQFENVYCIEIHCRQNDMHGLRLCHKNDITLNEDQTAEILSERIMDAIKDVLGSDVSGRPEP